MITKPVFAVDEFYEDWKKQTIAWNVGLSVEQQVERLEAGETKTEFEKGTRASLGLDTSIEAYRKDMKALQCNIDRGAVVEICPHCQSRKGTFKDMIYTCKCGKKWNPLKLMYRGFDDTYEK